MNPKPFRMRLHPPFELDAFRLRSAEAILEFDFVRIPVFLPKTGMESRGTKESFSRTPFRFKTDSLEKRSECAVFLKYGDADRPGVIQLIGFPPVDSVFRKEGKKRKNEKREQNAGDGHNAILLLSVLRPETAAFRGKPCGVWTILDMPVQKSGDRSAGVSGIETLGQGIGPWRRFRGIEGDASPGVADQNP